MDILRILLKYKLYVIPSRCPECDKILWGKWCDNPRCSVKTAERIFSFWKITRKEITEFSIEPK